MNQIFVNLLSHDIQLSDDFYSALGMVKNPDFSDETTSCFIVNEHIFFMLLNKEKFSQFTSKEIIDPRTQIQTLSALSVDSREELDLIMSKALAAGGTEPREASDLGFMYQRAIDDPSGNTVELTWMDPAGFTQ